VTDTARTMSPRKACENSREETTPGVMDATRTTSPRKACEKSHEETTPDVMDTARRTSPRKVCEKSREETTPGMTYTARTTSPRQTCEYAGSVSRRARSADPSLRCLSSQDGEVEAGSCQEKLDNGGLMDVLDFGGSEWDKTSKVGQSEGKGTQ